MISGKYILKIPLGNDIDVFVEAFNFQGGQYKKMGEKKIKDYCKTLYTDTYKKTFDDFNAASTVKVPFGTCPYPVMENVVTNFHISDDGQFPYIPGGEKWKIHIRFVKDNEVLGGYNMYALLRNEQTLMKVGGK